MTRLDFLSAWPHLSEIDVAWGEMDALGHINNAQYFRYFETARIEYLEQFNITIPEGSQIGPILAYIDCQYLAPVVFPDTLLIGTQVSDIGNTSVKLTQSVYSTSQSRIVAESKSVIVLVDYRSGGKIPIPDAIRTLLMQGRGNV